ncbi:MAG: hypothetical protein U0703_06310 [Anaerolineae bacterium]
MKRRVGPLYWSDANGDPGRPTPHRQREVAALNGGRGFPPRAAQRRDVEAEGVQLSNRILRRAREVGEFRRERVFGADQVPGSIRPLAVERV